MKAKSQVHGFRCQTEVWVLIRIRATSVGGQGWFQQAVFKSGFFWGGFLLFFFVCLFVFWSPYTSPIHWIIRPFNISLVMQWTWKNVLGAAILHLYEFLVTKSAAFRQALKYRSENHKITKASRPRSHLSVFRGSSLCTGLLIHLHLQHILSWTWHSPWLRNRRVSACKPWEAAGTS